MAADSPGLLARAAITALGEVGEAMFELSDLTLTARRKEIPDDTLSAYLPLMIDGAAVQVGLGAAPGVAAAMAAMLFECEEGETPADEDVVATLSELINVLAGGLKTIALETHDSVQLGLPFAMQGRVLPVPNVEVCVLEMKLGEWVVNLIVLEPHSAASRNAA